MDNGPLTGIRVVDLSRVLAGPFCSMNLGDMGADVIKVERPDGGDDTRSFGPPFTNGVSTYYLAINRNKRSIAIDLKREEGKAILWNLIENADVLLENFRPGTLDRLGFDYATCIERNPRLVYCSISAFGHAGDGVDPPQKLEVEEGGVDGRYQRIGQRDDPAEDRRIRPRHVEDGEIRISAEPVDGLVERGGGGLIEHRELRRWKRNSQVARRPAAIGEPAFQRALPTVEIDRHHALTGMGERHCDMEGEGRFSNAALLVRESDDVRPQPGARGNIADNVARGLVVGPAGGDAGVALGRRRGSRPGRCQHRRHALHSPP